jgi:hypothetical protein
MIISVGAAIAMVVVAIGIATSIYRYVEVSNGYFGTTYKMEVVSK